MRLLFVFVIVAAFQVSAAHANPDGAPWGSADPNAAVNCASCHYDNEAVADSPLILAGNLPNQIEPNQVYEILLLFGKIERKANLGFMVSARSAETVIGEFIFPYDTMETRGGEVRSIVPNRDTSKAIWPLKWRAPEDVEGPVTFYIAVNAGNDDQSSFGDEIHFKSVTVEAK